MRYEDVGLTAEMVSNALNGSDEQVAAIYDRVAQSGRLPEYLAFVRQHRPLADYCEISLFFQKYYPDVPQTRRGH
jgi:hypothetical protein